MNKRKLKKQFFTNQASFLEFTNAITGLVSFVCLARENDLNGILNSREDARLDRGQDNAQKLLDVVEEVKEELESEGWDLWADPKEMDGEEMTSDMRKQLAAIVGEDRYRIESFPQDSFYLCREGLGTLQKKQVIVAEDVNYAQALQWIEKSNEKIRYCRFRIGRQK
jgi:hypothetical protein